MGWGYCGTDDRGRDIGYNIPATCDHEGCDEEIHRGIAYVCGNMHSNDEYSCGQYFCDKHQQNFVVNRFDEYLSVCDDCAKILKEAENFKYDDDGEIKELS